MSDRDALVLTLVRGLEHAATALDVVNEATRRDIGALLSPKARRLLAALSAPTDAAAPRGDAAEAIEEPKPSIKTMKEIIRSAGLATADLFDRAGIEARYAEAMARLDEAERLKSQPKKRRHIAESSDDDDARPRTASGLQAFPEDVLGAVISFVDLPMRFSCVVACGAMRDAAAKLSPRLEHALVLRRYPMLATTGSSPTDATAPRDLLRTYKRYFRSTRRFAQTQPTTTLDEYTLSLEIDVTQALPQPEGALQRFRRRSLWIGTGTLSGGNSPAFEFTVPAGLFEIVDDYVESGWDLRANVMASRRIGGRVQVAKLFQGGVADWDETSIMFEWENIPHNRRNKALGWLQRVHDSEDLYMDPQLALYWFAEAGKVDARFVFSTENDRDDMSLSDACLTLEHFAEWSK